MIPIDPNELIKSELAENLAMVMPDHLLDTLIGEQIEGTFYYKTLEGDPTKSGYILLNAGTPVERKIYKTLHTPTGSSLQYRKLNHLVYGDCWEVVPK